MEATGREEVKRDTLEKDFDHDVEVKEHGKQINATQAIPWRKMSIMNFLRLRDLKEETDQKKSIKDVEEKVPEQKQVTTISTLEKDLAHGCEDSKLVDDDKVEKGKKARAGSVFKFTAEEEYIGGLRG